MKKLAILLAFALLLASASALADVGKGDRGEEVRYLQWLLQRTGKLNEKPDGIFGGHTEQAVMDYQESLGLEPTGVADADLMQRLDRERVRQDKLANGADYYEPYSGSYVPPYATGSTVPFHCETTSLGDLASRDFCERHLAILTQEYQLTADDSAEGYAEASALWLEEIEAMYGEWADGLSGERREQVQLAREAWNAAFEAQHAALNAAAGDPAVAEHQYLLALKNHAATLCELRSGELPAPVSAQGMLRAVEVEPEDPFLAGAADPVLHCESWSISRNTEFVTCCDSHAGLMERELAWSDGGAEDVSELRAIADGWKDALDALYDRWQAARQDEAAGAIQAAREAFDEALSRQQALYGGDMAALAGLRISQFEAARLCELVNGAE